MQMIAQLNQNIWVALIISINCSTFYLLPSYFTVNIFPQLPHDCTILYNSTEQFKLVGTGKIEFNRFIFKLLNDQQGLNVNKVILAHDHLVNCPTR